MSGLPSGTVTFLFTDIEGSTRLWEEHADAMREALARHDSIVRTAIEANSGHVVKTTGDGFHAAFATAHDGIAAATALQLELVHTPWPETTPVRVRVGVHTGEAQLRDGDYYGAATNRAARLMGVAHGGQIVVSDVTAALARDAIPADVSLRDLGTHRLRDLPDALRVFQVVHPELGSTFPPLRSLDAVPGNLLRQMSLFVGREQELHELGRVLEECSLVTLTGVGGVGKTRLALEAAGDVAPRYPGGVWLVELAGLNDPDGLVDAVAATLRVPHEAATPIEKTLFAALGRAPTLLLVDNCEHLIAPVADFVSAALGHVPTLTLLCTSREGLGAPGERVVVVSPLRVPAADEVTPEPTDAELLFVQRASAVRSTFSLTEQNAEAVARVCRRLDGIPLAIELAAARVRSMTPEEIAQRLDHRFQLLTGGARGATSRHQTLRQTLDWSYESLPDGEAELLEQLSVCVGTFDLPGAENIGTGGDDGNGAVVDRLDRLVDKSLVVAEHTGVVTRYRMLETIRDYAFERLEARGKADEARQRHAGHYASLAEEAGRGLRGPDERAWLERAEQEIDNLRAAVTWSIEGGDGEIGLRVLAALDVHGVRLEAIVSSWAAAVAAATAASNHPFQPIAPSLAAWRLVRDGELEAARRLAGAALALPVTADVRSRWARSRVFATTTAIPLYAGETDAEQAEAWVQAALAIPDDYEVAQAWTMLSSHLVFAGAGGAVEAAEAAIAAAHRSGSPTARALALMGLGQAVADDDPLRALRLLDEAILTADTAANEWAAATIGGIKGVVLARMGASDAAREALLETADRMARAGHRTGMAMTVWTAIAPLASYDRAETAAMLVGYVRSVVGRDDLTLVPGFPIAPVVALTEQIGDERFASLADEGAALTDEEALRLLRGAFGAPSPEDAPR